MSAVNRQVTSRAGWSKPLCDGVAVGPPSGGQGSGGAIPRCRDETEPPIERVSVGVRRTQQCRLAKAYVGSETRSYLRPADGGYNPRQSIVAPRTQTAANSRCFPASHRTFRYAANS